jgi:hypothetical protein
MIKSIAVAALGAILGSSSEFPDDELCNRLDRLDSQVMKSGPQSVSIRVTWDWANWTVACTHGGEVAAKELCSWLPSHMSREFPHILIRRVFACYQIEDRVAADQVEAIDRFAKAKSGNRLHIEAGNLRSGVELPWLRLTIQATM